MGERIQGGAATAGPHTRRVGNDENSRRRWKGPAAAAILDLTRVQFSLPGRTGGNQDSRPPGAGSGNRIRKCGMGTRSNLRQQLIRTHG